MKLPAPNRIAVYLTGLAGLATAVAVPVAELDTSSTIGVVGGLAAIVGVAVKFLEGWQRHEDRTEPFINATPVTVTSDQEDAESMRPPESSDTVG